MNTKKIKNLATTIQALDSSRFYTVNGHGIISFKSDIEFQISRNSTCFLNDEISSKEACQLVKALNEAIEPVLAEYKKIAKEQIKSESNII